jgi:hypothetical protein
MKKIILILSILALFSCSNKKSTEHVSQAQTVSNSGLMQRTPFKLIEIDTENSIEITRSELDSCVTELKYIYLKTEEPIGYVNKVIFRKNKLFVVDAFSAGKIFIFDMEGNLINIISDKGPGPNEYKHIVDADISTDEIIINASLKMLYYTLEGKFIRQEKCLPCLHFAMLGDKFILQADYDRTLSNFGITPNLIVSIKDSAIRGALPYSNIQKQDVKECLHYNYKGDILFLPSFSDTVYQILTESTYIAKYVVKHKKSIWKKHNESLRFPETNRLIKEDGYSELATEIFNETEKYVHFVLSVGEAGQKVGKIYWYDKESKQTYNLKIDLNENWVSRFIPYAWWVWGNYYVVEMWPDQIIAIREHQKKTKGTKDMFNIQNAELRNIIEMGGDDPNQAIVLYKYDFNKLKKH